MGVRRLVAAWALPVLAIGVTAMTAPAAGASSSPTPDPRKVCDAFPILNGTGFVQRLACDVNTAGAAGPLQDAGRNAAQPVVQAGQAVADAAETAFTRWVANGAAWIVQGTSVTLAGSSTTPSLDPRQASMFGQVYGRVAGVALALSVLLVLIGIFEATLTQRPGGLRRVVVGIAVSGIGLGVVPVATAILVRVVDDLSTYVAGDQSRTVSQAMAALIQALQQTNDPGEGAVVALTSLGVMLGGLLLWLELVTRGALIYLFVGVAPLACAAIQWPRLEGVLRHVLFAGLALILSKLLIIITLAVGFAVLLAAPGLATLVAGMFIIVIAALMPFATARVLPLAAEELSHSHQGRVRGWIVAGTVGATMKTASAIASGGANPARAVPIARPMGSSDRRGSNASGGARTAGRSSDAAAAGASASESRSARRPASGRPRAPEHGPAPGAASGS